MSEKKSVFFSLKKPNVKTFKSDLKSHVLLSHFFLKICFYKIIFFLGVLINFSSLRQLCNGFDSPSISITLSCSASDKRHLIQTLLRELTKAQGNEPLLQLLQQRTNQALPSTSQSNPSTTSTTSLSEKGQITIYYYFFKLNEFMVTISFF